MKYTYEETNLIVLCSFTEITYRQRQLLLSDMATSEPDFAKYEKTLIKSLPDSVYNKVRADFYDGAYRDSVLSGLEKRGITCITYFSKGYPESLKATDIPPTVLYLKGNIGLLDTECFAVVGSRRTAPNVLKECKKISSELTRHFTVVSGMADGADAAAVEGAMESGKIISVLAYGFDYAYPAVNRQLIKRVEEKGLLVSEYPPEIPPQKHQFPIRNRIIAGLSKGVLVASAGAKSGALITAGYAAEYGREVFALPYSVGVPSGAGCNFLIKNYGRLAENTLDIFGYFGLDFKPREEVALPKEEAELLAAIKESGEAFITELAEKLGTLPFMLIPTISKLEIKGLVVRLGGNRFSAI